MKKTAKNLVDKMKHYAFCLHFNCTFVKLWAVFWRRLENVEIARDYRISRI
ncbi:MAG: hypothetical protein IJU59_04775 [Firmicutes bacterium]|jgi:hypothetical protein|nr:hypothetical protein [Bacillota bacterium]